MSEKLSEEREPVTAPTDEELAKYRAFIEKLRPDKFKEGHLLFEWGAKMLFKITALTAENARLQYRATQFYGYLEDEECTCGADSQVCRRCKLLADRDPSEPTNIEREAEAIFKENERLRQRLEAVEQAARYYLERSVINSNADYITQYDAGCYRNALASLVTEKGADMSDTINSYKPNYNKFGHEMNGRTEDGYAQCVRCGAHENQPAIIAQCPESPAGKTIDALSAELEQVKAELEATARWRDRYSAMADKAEKELEQVKQAAREVVNRNYIWETHPESYLCNIGRRVFDALAALVEKEAGK